jgi:hypothetical protein
MLWRLRRPLCGGQPIREVPPLALTENVRVHREDGPRIVTQVLGYLMNGRTQAQPVRCGVVTQGVATESERELAHDADLQLPSELIREQIVAWRLAGDMRAEDPETARGQGNRSCASPGLRPFSS